MKAAVIVCEVCLSVLQIVSIVVLGWVALVAYLVVAIFDLTTAASILDLLVSANRRANAFRMRLRDRRIRL